MCAYLIYHLNIIYMKNTSAWEEKAKLLRKWCLVSTTAAGSGHPTSCLSAADIATVLFDKYFTYDVTNPLNIYNDRFVLSKGHAAPLLYALFGMSNAYDLNELKTLRKLNSRFEGHPVPKYKYAEAATGSLGQGLSVGAGLAIAAKRENLPFTTYVLCGDGELAEGQVWEAANFASYHKLNNLVVILDINRLAQSGETMFGHHMNEYEQRFRAFNFRVFNIDGHNFDQIDQALEQAHSHAGLQPVAIIARTEKGKGVSFIENKEGWHGKALKEDELKKALDELGPINDNARFELRKPATTTVPSAEVKINTDIKMDFDNAKSYATREVFGEVLAQITQHTPNMYVLDADVKNSTFTEDALKVTPERFVECFIAEQNMVSVGAGLSRIGKIPVVATFGAFFMRAADQIRMARISEANIKLVGSHVGVSIGEDGPSQMALEDIAFFGALPDVVVLQPCEAVSTASLVPQMVKHNGMVYMRTLRPKTKLLYKPGEEFKIGGSKIVRKSDDDMLTVAATGITVYEALQAADMLKQEDINIRVVDCYSISPIDRETLQDCLHTTHYKCIISVEDHFSHGGLGDFISAAVSAEGVYVEKMAVTHISQSGKQEELLKDAGIDAASIAAKVKELVRSMEQVHSHA
ncbi:Transketolase [Niastella koreensis GR20-10]|uniref:Transketolase n=2 Tax=Niastella koreensis TaxID=354356 RepID=G8TND7_NIAKG|nr:Transketolase [Niastella koreensis GR20-10]